MKMGKTENDLDERFQWKEGMDPDHIFEEEYEMIKELRKTFPQLQQETDKFVATFLFARRHHMKDVVSLMKKFYHKKEEYAPHFDSQHTPSLTYTKIMNGGGKYVGNLPFMQPTGFRDNKERMVRYLALELDDPASRLLPMTYALCFWEVYFQVATEPLNVWRNGTVFILDLKNVGFRNIDLSTKGIEAAKALQGIYPTRIRAIWGINGGIIVSALVASARLLLPSKLMDRFKLIKDIDRLKELIPEKFIPPRFGGDPAICDYTFEDFYNQVLQTEEQLFAKGIWQMPQTQAHIDGASECKDGAK